MGKYNSHRHGGKNVREFGTLGDTQTILSAPGPGLALKRRPSFKDNSTEPDMQRVVLKQAQSNYANRPKAKPSMPKMPWEDK